MRSTVSKLQNLQENLNETQRCERGIEAVEFLLQCVRQVRKELSGRITKKGNRPDYALYELLPNLANLYRQVTGKEGTAYRDRGDSYVGKGTLLIFFQECLIPIGIEMSNEQLYDTWTKANKMWNARLQNRQY